MTRVALATTITQAAPPCWAGRFQRWQLNMYAKDVRQPRGNYRTCRLQHTRDFVSGNMRLTPPPPHVLLSTELSGASLGAADHQVMRVDNCELLQYNMLKF